MKTFVNTLVEAQKAMFATVSSIDAKFGALNSRLDKKAPSSLPHGAQRIREHPATSYTISFLKPKARPRWCHGASCQFLKCLQYKGLGETYSSECICLQAQPYRHHHSGSL